MQNSQEIPFEAMTEKEQLALINAKLDELIRFWRIRRGMSVDKENGEENNG